MKNKVRSYDAVFALLLFLGFAASALMALLIGAGVYQRIQGSVVSRFSEETCVSYITTKLRTTDSTEYTVSVGEVGGGRALNLTEVIGGIEYTTVIYYFDGYVREMFAESGFEFEPEDGARIIEASSLEFDFELDGGLLRTRCIGSGGTVAESYISIRSGRERT